MPVDPETSPPINFATAMTILAKSATMTVRVPSLSSVLRKAVAERLWGMVGNNGVLFTVLVQREMECRRSRLVSIARVSAGRRAADRNGDRHEEAGTETATGFKKEIMVGNNSAPGSPDTEKLAAVFAGLA